MVVVKEIDDSSSVPPASNSVCSGVGGSPSERLGSDDPEETSKTSWVDALTAYSQIRKGKATGNLRSLWLRWVLQKYLFRLGCFIQLHCGKVLFLGILFLSLCCIGLKTVTLETNVEKLWVEAGGRISKELQYTEHALGKGSGVINELVMQTSSSGTNVLSVDSLLLHLEVLQAAISTTVDMFDISWKFRDICHAASFPNIDDDSMMDQVLHNLQPCIIVSPLDCFWEGSKLLGPDYPITIPNYPDDVTWMNLNPLEIVKSLSYFMHESLTEHVNNLLHRAGVTTGYQEKPCLNPNDPDCPTTAPNYKSKKVPDIGSVVSGGCHGFSKTYMHWKEDMILGAVDKNKSGHIVRAEALQSMIQVMGEKDFYEYQKGTYKVHSTEWTQNKAKLVLDAWEKEFTREIQKAIQSKGKKVDNVYSFTSSNFVEILDDFSQINPVRIVLCYILLLVYACLSLVNVKDVVRSQAGIGIAGIMLVVLTVAAGLGICSVAGIIFTAATTQILPFLIVGLGIDDIFIIAHVYEQLGSSDIAFMDLTGECLKRIGVTVLLTSVSNCCAFFMAALVPIPAMRAFCIQCGVLILFNLASVLLVFPAVVSLDLTRRQHHRVDLFCCFSRPPLLDDVENALDENSSLAETSSCEGAVHSSYLGSQKRPSSKVHQAIAQTQSDGSRPVTILVEKNRRNIARSSVPSSVVSPSSQCLSPNSTSTGVHFDDTFSLKVRQMICGFSFSGFARNVYGPYLERTPTKVVVILLFVVLLAAGIFGILQVKDGLDITDVVPRSSIEYNFFDAQSKYFGFYNFFAATQKIFDYASSDGQQLLFEYHNSFSHVDNIIKNDDGSLPDFWLTMFRTWLIAIQQAFDDDVRSGSINKDGWLSNSTSEGRLGYKLIVQTGSPSVPIDKRRFNKSIGRLIDQHDVIYPPAFYVYLTAWASNDQLAYLSSQASLVPRPREWIHYESDPSLEIPKSSPLIFAQSSFHLHKLGHTEAAIATLGEIRDICDRFNSKGLPNYPHGVPFTYWEQYFGIRLNLTLALVACLTGVFVIISVVLLNLWAATFVVAILVLDVVQLFGFMGLFGIKMSAIPAVVLIITVGIGVEFTVHMTLAFLSSIGSRNRRMKLALESVFSPVVHGAMSTLLGVITLAGSEFDFVIKYFFGALSMLVVIGSFNGLVLLPVLLSIFGPPAEVVPADNSDYLEPLSSPERSSAKRNSRTKQPSRRKTLSRFPVEIINLSTITEESFHSHGSSSSIAIEINPTIVVQSTSSSRNSTPSDSSVASDSDESDLYNVQKPCCNCSANKSFKDQPPVTTRTFSSGSGHRHVTMIRATAKVKVEVHSSTVQDSRHSSPEFKSKKRKSNEMDNLAVIKSFDTRSRNACRKS